MQIIFEDENVKELFDDLNDVQNSRNLMRRKIGDELTRAVKKKFNQIISFSNFISLLESRIGKIESLSGNREGTYSLRLSGNYRLIIEPVSEDLSAEKLRKCDTLNIKGVIDYHGKGSKNNWLIP